MTQKIMWSHQNCFLKSFTKTIGLLKSFVTKQRILRKKSNNNREGKF